MIKAGGRNVTLIYHHREDALDGWHCVGDVDMPAAAVCSEIQSPLLGPPTSFARACLCLHVVGTVVRSPTVTMAFARNLMRHSFVAMRSAGTCPRGCVVMATMPVWVSGVRCLCRAAIAALD